MYSIRIMNKVLSSISKNNKILAIQSCEIVHVYIKANNI